MTDRDEVIRRVIGEAREVIADYLDGCRDVALSKAALATLNHIDNLLAPVTKEKSDDVIHILLEGFPLCGFSDRLPGEWPDGHRWVRAEEQADATCSACRIIERLRRRIEELER